MKKFLAVLVLAVTGLVAWTGDVTGYKVGDVAADFKLKNVDGKMVSLANYKQAKGYIVVFTCNHCPYAKAYESRIMDLDKMYASKGYPVIAISPNDPVSEPADSFDNMKKLATEKGYSFPYTIDETQNVTRTYGAKATPHVYVLQKTAKGNVVQYIGAIDNDTEGTNPARVKYVENAVNALLEGKTIATNSTKAIGCSIKWKKGV
ncbi:thioredoxin family protein [Mucilaginibacter paludis]|uniref:Alkyl hydroperoxide reductase/ Thiol specific antioxidant/ Mal allergen n=1 Tax=Mucilaginibacter paludis DSM 18603 TaxID=714943 RepID=H1Y7F9_9SPHI|nr:thioredoxin family protein [Mucilaginibacter paludis]EHQ29380.1 alkyl hydroperoxide reductase/ Thiol specific antioxidant/ Mal allergen [Mucilaginibacter paludis DSM 18603]